MKPTKLIEDMSLFSIKASTTSLSPFITLTNPFGAPASSNNSTNFKELEGSLSEGFKMNAFPHAVAIGNIHRDHCRKIKRSYANAYTLGAVS